jgi:uncharacterized protein Yka (UPF0111/DUF47 family)
MPCFYCLDPHVSISVCIGCRTKLEAARDRIQAYKKEADGWRRGYHHLLNEKLRQPKPTRKKDPGRNQKGRRR